jgi:hypothetical protein
MGEVDHRGIFDEADDAPVAGASRADQRIDLIDFFDQPGPRPSGHGHRKAILFLF